MYHKGDEKCSRGTSWKHQRWFFMTCTLHYISHPIFDSHLNSIFHYVFPFHPVCMIVWTWYVEVLYLLCEHSSLTHTEEFIIMTPDPLAWIIVALSSIICSDNSSDLTTQAPNVTSGYAVTSENRTGHFGCSPSPCHPEAVCVSLGEKW